MGSCRLAPALYADGDRLRRAPQVKSHSVMRQRLTAVLKTLPVALLAVLGCHSVAPRVESLSGPAVVGIFAAIPEDEIADEPGGSEALAHLQFAVADTRDCLAIPDLTARIVFGDSVTLVSDGATHDVKLRGGASYDIARVLFRADAEPVVVYGPVGPSSLQVLLPNAAAEYFSEPRCRVGF